MGNRTGFTMMEMLVVIVIIGIIAAASTPVFLNITRMERLKSGSRYIVSALKSARAYAIAQRMQYAVNLYLGEESIGTAIKKAIEIYETPDFKKMLYLPTGIKVTDGSNSTDGIITYTFGSLGQVNVNPSNAEVRVKNMEADTSDKLRYYKITVYELTGQVVTKGLYKKDGSLE